MYAKSNKTEKEPRNPEILKKQKHLHVSELSEFSLNEDAYPGGAYRYMSSCISANNKYLAISTTSKLCVYELSNNNNNNNNNSNNQKAKEEELLVSLDVDHFQQHLLAPFSRAERGFTSSAAQVTQASFLKARSFNWSGVAINNEGILVCHLDSFGRFSRNHECADLSIFILSSEDNYSSLKAAISIKNNEQLLSGFDEVRFSPWDQDLFSCVCMDGGFLQVFSVKSCVQSFEYAQEKWNKERKTNKKKKEGEEEYMPLPLKCALSVCTEPLEQYDCGDVSLSPDGCHICCDKNSSVLIFKLFENKVTAQKGVLQHQQKEEEEQEEGEEDEDEQEQKGEETAMIPIDFSNHDCTYAAWCSPRKFSSASSSSSSSSSSSVDSRDQQRIVAVSSCQGGAVATLLTTREGPGASSEHWTRDVVVIFKNAVPPGYTSLYFNNNNTSSSSSSPILQLLVEGKEKEKPEEEMTIIMGEEELTKDVPCVIRHNLVKTRKQVYFLDVDRNLELSSSSSSSSSSTFQLARMKEYTPAISSRWVVKCIMPRVEKESREESHVTLFRNPIWVNRVENRMKVIRIQTFGRTKMKMAFEIYFVAVRVGLFCA